MRRIYQKMDFWPFVRARGRIHRYLKSQENYQKNAYQISTEDISTVNRHWKFAFEEWGYNMQITSEK